jgi:DNA-binding protein YbaB
MSSIGKLMKQAVKIQQKMEEVQGQLSARTVSNQRGGAVKSLSGVTIPWHPSKLTHRL